VFYYYFLSKLKTVLNFTAREIPNTSTPSVLNSNYHLQNYL